MAPRVVEAGRDDGDADLVAQRLVHHGADDDVGVALRRFLPSALAASFTSWRARSAPPVMLISTPRAPLDGRLLEQRARDRLLRRVDGAMLSPRAMPVPMSAMPMPDMIVRTSAKSRLIRPWTSDQVGDALHRLLQHVVGDCGTRPSSDVPARATGEEALVRNRRAACRPIPRSSWMPASAWRMRRWPSNSNGLVTHADRQRAELLRDAADHRRGAGAGAAAHAGGDEHHVRAGRGLAG